MHEGGRTYNWVLLLPHSFLISKPMQIQKFPTPLLNNTPHIENDKTIREVTQLVHLSYYYPITYRLNPYRIEQGY